MTIVQEAVVVRGDAPTADVTDMQVLEYLIWRRHGGLLPSLDTIRLVMNAIEAIRDGDQ